MTTSFTKEWSDDDSSHSSEEFMYVKGEVEGVEAKLDDGENEPLLQLNLKLHDVFLRSCQGRRGRSCRGEM